MTPGRQPRRCSGRTVDDDCSEGAQHGDATANGMTLDPNDLVCLEVFIRNMRAT